jgi:hypothetical protein
MRRDPSILADRITAKLLPSIYSCAIHGLRINVSVDKASFKRRAGSKSARRSANRPASTPAHANERTHQQQVIFRAINIDSGTQITFPRIASQTSTCCETHPIFKRLGEHAAWQIAQPHAIWKTSSQVGINNSI